MGGHVETWEVTGGTVVESDGRDGPPLVTFSRGIP